MGLAQKWGAVGYEEIEDIKMGDDKEEAKVKWSEWWQGEEMKVSKAKGETEFKY